MPVAEKTSLSSFENPNHASVLLRVQLGATVARRAL